MFSSMELATKGLLSSPTWNWVFKNTFDAIEEQLNKVAHKTMDTKSKILPVDLVCDGYSWNTCPFPLQPCNWRSHLHRQRSLCQHLQARAGVSFLFLLTSFHSLRTSLLSGPFHVSLSAYAAQEPGCRDKVVLAANPVIPDHHRHN